MPGIVPWNEIILWPALWRFNAGAPILRGLSPTGSAFISIASGMNSRARLRRSMKRHGATTPSCTPKPAPCAPPSRSSTLLQARFRRQHRVFQNQAGHASPRPRRREVLRRQHGGRHARRGAQCARRSRATCGALVDGREHQRYGRVDRRVFGFFAIACSARRRPTCIIAMPKIARAAPMNRFAGVASPSQRLENSTPKTGTSVI